MTDQSKSKCHSLNIGEFSAGAKENVRNSFSLAFFNFKKTEKIACLRFRKTNQIFISIHFCCLDILLADLSDTFLLWDTVFPMLYRTTKSDG